MISIIQCTNSPDTGNSYSGEDQLFVIPEGVESRWASAENLKGEKGKGGQANAGRKGSPCITDFKNGEMRVLAEAANTSGMVRRIWVTINDRSPQMLRGLLLQFYWDGSDKPAVSAPIGDFFSQGLGQMVTFQSALFASPEGRSFNCYIPMPFRTGMKITVTNESGTDLGAFFYDVDYTVGNKFPDNVLYFHAYFRRENPTVLQKDYEILPKVAGKGRYLGCNIGVIANQDLYYKTWWGEGEVKVYLDGDTEFPTLCGTGTEDYIGTGWGQGQYANLYQGCHLADHEKFRYCFYRLHVPDPVYFRQDARVTIQQIGWWGRDVKRDPKNADKPILKAGKELASFEFSAHGTPKDQGLFEREDDCSSCVWFYLDKPVNDLPPIASAEARISGL
ncbi:MAG TPA: glycoside hydrolase family 172 protein [Cyclobacteriaceae bacterium]|nr:glycoside hydrolase family 172 protein [Cyclobacteriaceae bacterium]